jgi:RNA polymerase sigma-70 factor (ECF subfamily)
MPPDSQPSFASQFEAAGPALMAWARLRVRPELRRLLDPEDLVQEVGCRAWRSLDAFDPARASFRQWLFGIANLVLLEALRELGRASWRAVGSDETGAPGLSGVLAVITSVTGRVARDEAVRLFHARLEALPAADRALLLHRGIEQLPHAQVAELFGISEDALRKRWQRLCEQLRDDPLFAALAG